MLCNMPRCICKNCKCSSVDPKQGRLCTKKMIFVHNDDYCPYFENDELFNPTKLVLFTVAVVAIVIFLSKIL